MTFHFYPAIAPEGNTSDPPRIQGGGVGPNPPTLLPSKPVPRCLAQKDFIDKAE